MIPLVTVVQYFRKFKSVRMSPRQSNINKRMCLLEERERDSSNDLLCWAVLGAGKLGSGRLGVQKTTRATLAGTINPLNM